MVIVGLPATVELEMYGGSELRLDDRLAILGGCHTTCLRLRISILKWKQCRYYISDAFRAIIEIMIGFRSVIWSKIEVIDA